MWVIVLREDPHFPARKCRMGITTKYWGQGLRKCTTYSVNILSYHQNTLYIGIAEQIGVGLTCLFKKSY